MLLVCLQRLLSGKQESMFRGGERNLAENWNYTLNMSIDANQSVIMEKYPRI